MRWGKRSQMREPGWGSPDVPKGRGEGAVVLFSWSSPDDKEVGRWLSHACALVAHRSLWLWRPDVCCVVYAWLEREDWGGGRWSAVAVWRGPGRVDRCRWERGAGAVIESGRGTGQGRRAAMRPGGLQQYRAGAHAWMGSSAGAGDGTDSRWLVVWLASGWVLDLRGRVASPAARGPDQCA